MSHYLAYRFTYIMKERPRGVFPGPLFSASRLGVVAVVEGHDLTGLGDEFLRQLALRDVGSEVEECGQLVVLNVELCCQLIEGHFRILSCCSYE